MMDDISLLFTLGLLVAGARLLAELLLWGRPSGFRGRHPEPPHTTAEIAEEGRMRAAQTDVSYLYYNDQIRQ